MCYLFITYDIVCQWMKKLPIRIESFPEHMRLDIGATKVRGAIPKGHIEAHGTKCHSKHSLNTQPGVGRTYGEGIEQQWSNINLVATSTREMGPGAREEVLNDHWNWWNYRKLVGFGMSFCITRKRILTHVRV